MAIRVTKPGKKMSKPKLVGTCYKCKCEIECTENDKRYMDGDGPHPGYDYVDCPNCDGIIPVEPRPITPVG